MTTTSFLGGDLASVNRRNVPFLTRFKWNNADEAKMAVPHSSYETQDVMAQEHPTAGKWRERIRQGFPGGVEWARECHWKGSRRSCGCCLHERIRNRGSQDAE
jgi:hypothetical protein